MSSNFGYAPDITSTLQGVTDELWRLQDLLLQAEQPDLRMLMAFRDVVNRLRQTAWAVQQYGELIADQKAAKPIRSILAGERIRTVCQLCKLLAGDLANPETHFQDGQLLGLHEAVQQLDLRLCEHTGN
jgi:parvulin-like peptidyl-prolyl isomerase